MLIPAVIQGQPASPAREFQFADITTGKVYKIVISSGWKTEGRVISQDSATITIKSKLNRYVIFRDQITALGKPSDEMITIEKPDLDSYNCNISLLNNEVITGLKLRGLMNDTLVCDRSLTGLNLPVDKVQTIQYVGKSQLWIGAAIGAVLGGLIGYIAGPDMSRQSDQGTFFIDFWWDMNWKPVTGILGVITGALIGTGISALIGMDMEYDLSKMNFQTKRVEINKIIEENK